MAPHASASTPEEAALAERYAPILRLVAQEEECGYGDLLVGIGVLVELLRRLGFAFVAIRRAPPRLRRREPDET